MPQKDQNSDKEAPKTDKELMDQATALITNGVRYIKKKYPTGYGKVIKKILRASDLEEEITLILKRKKRSRENVEEGSKVQRVRIGIVDESEESQDPEQEREEMEVEQPDNVVGIDENEGEEVEEDVVDEPVEQEQDEGENENNRVAFKGKSNQAKERVTDNNNFKDFVVSVGQAIEGLALQDQTGVVKPTVLPKLDTDFAEVGQDCIRCMKYSSKYSTYTTAVLFIYCFILFKKCEQDGKDATKETFDTFEHNEKRKLYRMKNAGCFMHKLLSTFNAKYGIIIAISQGIDKIKKMSAEKAADFIIMCMENEGDEVFTKMDEFEMPTSLQKIMKVAGYV